MRENRPLRFAREGADPTESRKIVAVGHSRIDKSKIYVQKISTINEYEAGCREHENCLGHMCETPSGLLLPPQYMGLRTNVMRNEIYAAAEHAFAPSSPYHHSEYNRILSGMMKRKDGKMRNNVLNAVVDGSLRMAATPHNEGGRYGRFKCPVTGKVIPAEKVVFIPYYLRDKFKVMRVDGETGRYVSEYVKDGDCALCVREPALAGGSTPLVKIYYWNHTALGIHPKLMKGLRGDYDGDEAHLYPVYSDEAVKCCEQWQVDPHIDFDRANEIYSTMYYPDRREGLMEFMWHTTMSFEEMKRGHPPPLMCEFNRMKLEHIEMFKQRCNTLENAKNLVRTSIDGLNSINVQQHSQPIVGDMSRIARLAASSVKQTKDGTIGIVSKDGFVAIHKSILDNNAGNSAVRAQSRLCATAQQVMLSAHRVTKSDMPAHDMIKDMVVGSTHTLVVLKARANVIATQCEDFDTEVKWSMTLGKLYYILCTPKFVSSSLRSLIVGAYNPSVLSYIPAAKRFKVCKMGVEQVFKQYDVPLSDTELDSLAVLYSYQVGNSIMPITSRDGISKRSVHWLEIVMATSYYTLCKMVENNDIPPVSVNTITSALVSCNFDLLE